jgi:ankyrin repeat protein
MLTVKFKKKYYVLSVFFIAILSISILSKNKSLIAEIKNIYGDNSSNEIGFNSLMTAVAVNDIAGVKFFSKGGESIINQQNIGGATAIHIAAREGNYEIIKILIDNKANINVIDKEGWTPLMRAALSGDFSSVELLVKNHADASLINIFGESVIIHVANSNCFRCLEVIVENFNFIKSMNFEELKKQISIAYISARNKENTQIINLLDKMLENASKLEFLKNESEDTYKINNFSETDLVVKNNIVEKDLSEISGKNEISNNASKFKFKIVNDAKISSYENQKERVIINKVLKKNRFKLVKESENIDNKFVEKSEDKKTQEQQIKPNTDSSKPKKSIKFKLINKN